jgi:hypothetical protein
MYSGQELEVGPSRIEFSGIRASIGEAEVGSGLAGGSDLRIARYPFKEKRGREAFPFVSGKADLRGQVAERELLGLFLQRAPWLSFGPSPGEVTAHLEVENGQVGPGTRADFVHPDLETSAFDFRAVGDARIHFEIRPDESGGSGRQAAVVVKYDDFTVHSGESLRPQFVGSGLSVVATTPALELGSILDSTRVQIDLGTARIPDLAAFNDWLPPSLGLVLTSGDGALSGSLDADLAANSAHGEFRAAIDAAKMRYRDLDLAGSVKVAVRIPSADLDRRAFDLAGTRLDLADFRSRRRAASPAVLGQLLPLTDGGPISSSPGSLLMPPMAAMKGASRSICATRCRRGLFETRKDLHWVERLLTVEDIRAGGTLAWNPAETALDDLSTEFRKATIRARLRLGREAKRGVMMVEWHRLALGLRIDNASRNWKLVGVRDWFAKADLGAPMVPQPEDHPLSKRRSARPSSAARCRGPTSNSHRWTSPTKSSPAARYAASSTAIRGRRRWRSSRCQVSRRRTRCASPRSISSTDGRFRSPATSWHPAHACSRSPSSSGKSPPSSSSRRPETPRVLRPSLSRCAGVRWKVRPLATGRSAVERAQTGWMGGPLNRRAEARGSCPGCAGRGGCPP